MTMDPAKTPLGKMLLEGITPVVMVLHTSLVEEACLKNGLTFVQMLSPFCSFSNIDVPVRTASDQPYRIQKFKLRLLQAPDIRKPNWEMSKERLKDVITQAGEKVFSELGSDPPQIDNVLGSKYHYLETFQKQTMIQGSESEVLPPWFQIFNEELLCAASFSEHEAFDHPVACLLAVSSNDEYPINRFVDFFNSDKLPSLFNDGSMDTKILKHYLLVHDNQDGNSEKAVKLLSEMRSTFGSNDCQLLCINSSQDGSVEYQDSPWDSLISEVSSNHHTGCLINNDDLNEIKDLMQDLSSQRIIPYMEEKIRLLNQQVSATRKGFRNQIKNLWWRKGKEDTVESPIGPIYTFSSIESQIRVLGDYAFMLRDYELALTNYRLISTDYKLDKAWKRYAGVQEMMGLAYFMLDQSRKEAEYCMENAFTTYLKIGSSAQQNATRCGIWWAEMLKTRDQYKEAAAVYSRICGEEILHSAVMLEQASFCYLLSTPPLLRKYGFHLVLSGDRYKRSDQIKHAIRTYRNALSIFKETMWSHIKDHVCFHIGQWYAFLGMYDVAVSQMLEVLACSHQSMATQELFLKDFLQTVQKTGRTFEVLKLQLPKINFSSLKIAFEDHRTYASPAAAGVKESLWRSLEEDMIPSLSSAKSNWLELQSKIVSKTDRESNICVAGELVKVDIELKNPLQIPISISGVSLICDLSTESTETSLDAHNMAVELQNDGELEKLISRDNRPDKSFTLSEVDFSLGGGETNIVQLSVTPNVEGILQILGVRWKLSSSIVGFHKFESDIGKKKTINGRQKSKHSPINNLKFIVIQSLPKLEGFIQQLPTIVYAGDLRPLVLELRNQSEYSVKNLKIKISHPRFFSIGKQEKSNIEFPACLEKTMTSEEGSTYDAPSMSNETFSFPQDTSIQKGKPFLWPLWFRAAVTGNISLRITIYYEMKDISSIMRYRTLRMQYSLQVLPSLDVSFQINPCSSRLQEFLVRMDVINRTSAEVYQVHQLSSVGKQWELSLLQPVDTIFPSRALIAGQALSVFFVLKDIKNLVGSEDRTSSLLPLSGSDLSLSPRDSGIKLFDTSFSPLADFHHSERLLQERTHVGDSNTVDFILISQSHKEGVQTGIQDPPRLISNYVCHCSTSSSSPILWLVDGPRTVYHDFSASFCKIKLTMTVQNSSNTVASVHIDTNDSTTSSSLLSDNEATPVGWYDVSQLRDEKVKSDSLGSQTGKSLSPESVSPFVWSGLCSRRVQLEPMSKTEIPLQICVFSQGTFDLSSYVLRWNLLPFNGEENSGGTSQSSGTCRGYPYYLTVLQST